MIDMSAASITFNDTTTLLGADTVQEIIELLNTRINTIEATTGDLSGTGILINGNSFEVNALLKDIVLSIANSAITTDKLANDAVTNDKIADDAVQSENIVDGSIATADLADGSVSSVKLIALPAEEGKVGVVQADGSVVYQNLDSSNIDGKDLEAEDSSILVTDGLGATLVDVKISVAEAGITTDKLANDAVTNDKIADDAVQSENIVDGSIATADLADGSVTNDKLNAGNSIVGNVATVVTNSNGVRIVEYVTPSVKADQVTNGNDLSSSDNSIQVTNGTKSTLVNVNVIVAPGGINTSKLADGAVTTSKLADDAVNQDKIADNSIRSEHILDGSIKASDLGALPGDNGKVATANQDGSVSFEYSKTTVDNVMDKKSLSGNGILINGNSSLEQSMLKEVTLSIADAAISTAKIVDQAVETIKIKDQNVTTSKLADDSVTAVKLNPDVVGQGLGQNTNGSLFVNTKNGLHIGSDNFLKLGGNLTETTTITNNGNSFKIDTNGAPTSIVGLPFTSENDYKNTNGAVGDKIVIVDDNGLLKQMKAAMPKFFYMPSVVLPVAADQIPLEMASSMSMNVSNGVFTINLYSIYSQQFGGNFATINSNSGKVANSSRKTQLPLLPSQELDYYITYFDTTVFQDVTVTNDVLLTYKIKPTADVNMGSFMNIVFAVRP